VGEVWFGQFSKCVVLGANALRILTRLKFCNDIMCHHIFTVRFAFPNFFENEGLVIGHEIESGFKLHLGFGQMEE